MTMTQDDMTATTRGADGDTPQTRALAIARQAVQLARKILLTEATRAGNTAAWRAVVMASWNLDTQALLLAPAAARPRLLRPGDDVTPPTHD